MSLRFLTLATTWMMYPTLSQETPENFGEDKDCVLGCVELGAQEGLSGGRCVDKSGARDVGDVALGLISLELVCKDFGRGDMSERVY